MEVDVLKREDVKFGDPLTLEQLRKMDGKPVWVDFTGSKIEREPGWFILKYMQGQEAHLVGKVNTYRAYECYGKTWIAYAYPPAHIDREAWEPCEFCTKADFGEFGFEIGRSYAKIACALGAGGFRRKNSFVFARVAAARLPRKPGPRRKSGEGERT